MMVGVNMKGFSEMFAPFDEGYAQEIAEKAGPQNSAGNTMDGGLPPGIDIKELE